MILCPVAAVAGCKSCLVSKLCLAKGILGDDKVQIELPDQDVDEHVGNSVDKINQVLK